ncbi:MAG: hypothetical protein ISP90_16405 [Nevskia sp.]|nr:hypothetical protein [Nevskia sp.]
MAPRNFVAGLLIPFASGLLFGFGLIVSGMTDPLRVQAFLDVAGHWNPALALVMGGAVAVTLPAFAYLRRGGRTLAGPAALPDRTALTPPLLAGSALFGIGWGISGVCPGPGIVIAAAGSLPALMFVASMVAGMAIHAWWRRRPAADAADKAQAAGA